MATTADRCPQHPRRAAARCGCTALCTALLCGECYTDHWYLCPGPALAAEPVHCAHEAATRPQKEGAR